MAIHARLSPSSAHRWLNCPGSVNAEKGLVDKGSANAREGSAAHELGELVLANGGSCFDWECKPLIEYNERIVDREMASNVQEYVDYVKGLGGEQRYEVGLDYSQWVNEGFGTSDAIALVGKTLYVVDLKYGKGLQVFAEKNEQGMLYALGALNEYSFADIEKVVIVIVQPRLDHIDEWETTPEELFKWGEWVSQRAEMCEDDNAERVPGEKQCQWCKAKATCPALKNYTEQVMLASFDNLDDQPSVNKLTDAQLRAALDAKKLVTSWFDAVETYVTDKLNNGESFGGYKLVAGRSLRQWGDEQEAAKALEAEVGDEAYSKKLLSPAQAEKLLGKKRKDLLEPLIVKPEGKPTLAPESDKRPAVSISVNDFEDLS